jgi:hypothetical protein
MSSQPKKHSSPSLGVRRYGLKLILELLAYAAESPLHPAHRIHAWPPEQVDERQIQWVIEAGLGPLLYQATRHNIDQWPGVWRDALRSAELTAKIRHGSLIHSGNEIIDCCEKLGVHITLLKGISISHQHYPAGHLRPMGDIDILIPEPDYKSVELAMLRHGYQRNSDHQLGEDPHHGLPLFHPERSVWVEIHTSLFRKSESLRRNSVFSPCHVSSQLVASTFYGKPVCRLTNELQLVYIASSWIKDLSRHGIHPSFLIPLFDAVYLLKASRRTLDWDSLLSWLDNDMAIASLYLMLVYLSRKGLDQSAAPILSHLARSQHVVGTLERRIILDMVDHYLVGGRPFTRFFTAWHATIMLATLLGPARATKLLSLPWNLVFPPNVPDRYSVAYQLKRITKVLHSRG